MGIDIREWDWDKVTYAVVPEEIPDLKVDAITDEVKFQNEVNGWTKERNLRKAGEVPFELMYNFYIMNCPDIKTISLEEFYNRDNCLMQKRLLNEFPQFKVGTHKYMAGSKLKGTRIT